MAPRSTETCQFPNRWVRITSGQPTTARLRTKGAGSAYCLASSLAAPPTRNRTGRIMSLAQKTTYSSDCSATVYLRCVTASASGEPVSRVQTTYPPEQPPRGTRTVENAAATVAAAQSMYRRQSTCSAQLKACSLSPSAVQPATTDGLQPFDVAQLHCFQPCVPPPKHDTPPSQEIHGCNSPSNVGRYSLLCSWTARRVGLRTALLVVIACRRDAMKRPELSTEIAPAASQRWWKSQTPQWRRCDAYHLRTLAVSS